MNAPDTPVPPGAFARFRYRGQLEYCRVIEQLATSTLYGMGDKYEPPIGAEYHRAVWKGGRLVTRGTATRR